MKCPSCGKVFASNEERANHVCPNIISTDKPGVWNPITGDEKKNKEKEDRGDSKGVKNMDEHETDFTELDDELDAILYDDRYRVVQDLWKKVRVSHRDIIWHWFLWSYSKIYKNGIFEKDGKMKLEAEREYNQWIEKNMQKTEEILKG
jgi:hypothetical protein